MVDLPAPDTIGEGAGLRRDCDPELAAQPLREALVQRDRARAVADRETGDQVAVGRLIEPIERRTFAGVADRLLEIADRGGRVGEHR